MINCPKFELKEWNIKKTKVKRFEKAIIWTTNKNKQNEKI